MFVVVFFPARVHLLFVVFVCFILVSSMQCLPLFVTDIGRKMLMRRSLSDAMCSVKTNSVLARSSRRPSLFSGASTKEFHVAKRLLFAARVPETADCGAHSCSTNKIIVSGLCLGISTGFADSENVVQLLLDVGESSPLAVRCRLSSSLHASDLANWKDKSLLVEGSLRAVESASENGLKHKIPVVEVPRDELLVNVTVL